MPTAEQVRDITIDTLGSARGRAEELVNRAVDLAHDVDLASVEVPAYDDLVERAASHKVRTTLIVSLVALLVIVLLRKMISGSDDPAPDSVG